MSKPMYRAKKDSFIHDRIVKSGEEFAFNGVPSRHWEPLNDAAKEKAKEIKPSGFSRLDQKRAAAKAAKQDPVVPVEDEDSGDDENKIDPANLTETQKQKLILDALGTLKHDDAAHWTQGGEPDLNVMKERLGFAVKRGEIKEVAPEFVRTTDA